MPVCQFASVLILTLRNSALPPFLCVKKAGLSI
jgi:hypothetical protein